MDRQRILITGSSGFIGHHLVDWYVNDSADVVAISRSNQPAQVARPGAKWISMELSSPEFSGFVAGAKPDVVIHTAGPSSVSKSFDNPRRDLDDSIESLENVLEAIRRFVPTCRVLFLSSAAVYGDPFRPAMDELSPTNPISPYGYHKRLCENLLEEYHELYGLDICVARIFSAYGPGLKRQIFWDICERAVNNSVLDLDGHGSETRDFIYIQDLVSALARLASADSLQWPVYNVGSGGSVSIREAANSMLEALELKRELRFSGYRRLGDPAHWQADITRLQEIGFSTTVTLDHGLAEYARWYRAIKRVC